ncbi:unnamed protein product, partial [Closterium sp. NIES-53]
WWIPPVPSTPPPLPQVPELYQMSLDFFRSTATNLPTIQLLPVPLLPLPPPPPVLQVPELYQMSLDFFRTTATNLPTIHALAATAAPGGTAGASEAVEGEVQQLERVCASNATALFVAHRAGAGSVLKASFEFSAHPFFPGVCASNATAGVSEAVEGEVQHLERVCASNATALFVAHRAGAGSVLKASFEFSAHPFFHVVTLKRTHVGIVDAASARVGVSL